MKKIIGVILLLLVCSLLTAEVDGSKGFQALRISVDPASAAQGGTGGMHISSGFSFLDNPASGMIVKGKVLSFSQNFWLFDTSLSSIGYVTSQGRNSFGIAMRYLDYGKVENRDDTGALYGEYHPMDMIVSFNLGYRILASHYLGVNLSFLYEQIDDASSTGASLDLGYIYRTPLQGLNLLASVKNLGIASKVDKDEIELPLTFELGLSELFPFSGEILSAEAKLIKETDNDQIKGNLGVQINVHRNLSLRSGYKLNSDLEGFSCGFGVKVSSFLLNYAFLPIGEDLDDVHQLGLSWQF